MPTAEHYCRASSIWTRGRRAVAEVLPAGVVTGCCRTEDYARAAHAASAFEQASREGDLGRRGTTCTGNARS